MVANSPLAQAPQLRLELGIMRPVIAPVVQCCYLSARSYLSVRDRVPLMTR
jgi:hypothetical protein